jgi:hypothetical protein
MRLIRFLTGIATGLNNRVLNSVVNIEGKFKMTTSADNNILKIQKVIGLTPYDALDLSCNTGDKTSILTISNIDILASLVSTNVYTKEKLIIIILFLVMH